MPLPHLPTILASPVNGTEDEVGVALALTVLLLPVDVVVNKVVDADSIVIGLEVVTALAVVDADTVAVGLKTVLVLGEVVVALEHGTMVVPTT